MNIVSSITKPSITRLARRAGVKSLSEDCLEIIKHIILSKLNEIIVASLIVNSENQTKTLMVEDIYDSLMLLNENISQSSELGTSTSNK